MVWYDIQIFILCPSTAVGQQSRFWFDYLQERRQVLRSDKLGAIHKVHHAIFGQFLPSPSPLSHFVTHPGTPSKVRHTSRTPLIFRRSSTKNLDKSPLVQILSQLFAVVFVRGVCQGAFVWKVLSGVVLSVPVLSEYICYIRKLNITLNFTFRMYDKKFISVTSHALYHPPLSQTVTPSRTPLERDVLYGRPRSRKIG